MARIDFNWQELRGNAETVDAQEISMNWGVNGPGLKWGNFQEMWILR